MSNDQANKDEAIRKYRKIAEYSNGILSWEEKRPQYFSGIYMLDFGDDFYKESHLKTPKSSV